MHPRVRGQAAYRAKLARRLFHLEGSGERELIVALMPEANLLSCLENL
jgi:hypothetical protein